MEDSNRRIQKNIALHQAVDDISEANKLSNQFQRLDDAATNPYVSTHHTNPNRYPNYTASGTDPNVTSPHYHSGKAIHELKDGIHYLLTGEQRAHNNAEADELERNRNRSNLASEKNSSYTRYDHRSSNNYHHSRPLEHNYTDSRLYNTNYRTPSTFYSSADPDFGNNAKWSSPRTEEFYRDTSNNVRQYDGSPRKGSYKSRRGSQHVAENLQLSRANYIYGTSLNAEQDSPVMSGRDSFSSGWHLNPFSRRCHDSNASITQGSVYSGLDKTYADRSDFIGSSPIRRERRFYNQTASAHDSPYYESTSYPFSHPLESNNQKALHYTNSNPSVKDRLQVERYIDTGYSPRSHDSHSPHCIHVISPRHRVERSDRDTLDKLVKDIRSNRDVRTEYDEANRRWIEVPRSNTERQSYIVLNDKNSSGKYDAIILTDDPQRLSRDELRRRDSAIRQQFRDKVRKSREEAKRAVNRYQDQVESYRHAIQANERTAISQLPDRANGYVERHANSPIHSYSGRDYFTDSDGSVGSTHSRGVNNLTDDDIEEILDDAYIMGFSDFE